MRRRLRRTSVMPELQQLVAACEAGLDLPAILTTAATAVGAALDTASVSAYTLSEDGEVFTRVCGRGPDVLPADESTEPQRENGTVRLPMVSARRVLGAIVAEQTREDDLAAAATIAGIAAQAVEAARMWESGAAGNGMIDLLTGLPNHRGFTERAARELSRAKRTGSVVSMAVVDIDGFGALNDVHGHAAGDTLLRTAARCFAEGVRSYDSVCRLGRDEFGLVLPGMTSAAAATLMSRLAQAFATSTDGITVSGGVACFPIDGATHGELQRLATGALYWAQRGGGGRIVSYDARVVEALSARERADQLERDTYERTIRALEATHGHSSTSRAVSEYSGFLASEMGLTPDRADRLRLAAFVYDSTTPGGEPAERARLAAKVAVNALDAEAADWLLAAKRGRDAPLESRIVEVAAAFVEAGGHTGSAGAGRALAELWAIEPSVYDPDVVRALESLLADRVGQDEAAIEDQPAL
jgi:diguanylate cyclase (GGDEF)-like protein